MSRVQIMGRSLRMLPIEVAGTHISTIWSANTYGSYMGTGGHVGISNLSTANNDLCVWIGDMSTTEFVGSNGTHLSPSLDDIVDLNQGPILNPDNRQTLPEDPYGRYAQKVNGSPIPMNDGAAWTADQLTYAREFIRKFGVRVPRNALYEPLVAPTSVIYIVSDSDAQRQVGNIIT